MTNRIVLFPGPDSDLGTGRSTETAGAAEGGLLSKPHVEETKTDKMEESLTCVICQDLLHDCIRWEIRSRSRIDAWMFFLVLHVCAYVWMLHFSFWASSLQPCMHAFCAACYSGWMERSSLCPTCRCPVERICKNHILNNLVEAYLIQHPGLLTSTHDGDTIPQRSKCF